MDIATTVTIGKLTLKNPVIVASGTFGYGNEYEDLIDVESIGAVVTKTITIHPQQGNPSPRICETPAGMLNSIGLANVGMDVFLRDKVPYFENKNVALIVSVAGKTPENFLEVIERCDDVERIDALELNVSCPNVKYGDGATQKVLQFAQDINVLSSLVRDAREATKKTLIAKLSPEVSDIAATAYACQKAGCDAVGLVNTFRGMAIDVATRTPRIAKIVGGVSGPAIRPLALRMVWEVAQKVSVPIIGMGGIMTAEDALEFLIAGASAVSIGTATFVDPRAAIKIRDGIEKYMYEHKISDIKELVGTLNPG